MLSEEQLREIEERSSRISPGPWTWYCYRRGYEIVTMPSERKVVRQDGGVCWVRDADFISHAREDVPAMWATIGELQTRLAELETRLVDAEHGFKVALGDSGEYRRQVEELEARLGAK